MKTSDNIVTQRHFSHHHPLVLSNVQREGGITCSACNLKVLPGKEYYRCVTCQFALHQVCYNMPRKMQHPGHPIHDLNLLVAPKKESFNCKACRNQISGFYYNCEKCRVSFHILCSNLPLSVAITSHPHTVKLEFTPPYDFECDLCEKPCHNNDGWSYRCQFCEFDMHLACAISDKRTELGKQFRKMELGNEKNEITQWILQGMVYTSVTGWDDRLSSPIMPPGTIRGIRSSHSTPGRSGPIYGDASVTTPSYQLTESCFSIDLENSEQNQIYRHNMLFDTSFDIPKETKQDFPEFNKIRRAANYTGLEIKMSTEALLFSHGATSSGKGLDLKIQKKETMDRNKDRNSISDSTIAENLPIVGIRKSLAGKPVTEIALRLTQTTDFLTKMNKLFYRMSKSVKFRNLKIGQAESWRFMESLKML
ncbi:hypothetical protein ACFE04_029763 [Oxalis oulophora]